MDGTQPFSLAKPTSSDVLGCSGALASAGMSTADLALGAILCAALNRGVAAGPTALWYRRSAYYTARPDNEYAALFHSIAIGQRAYGFPYDDVNDQSSVAILPDPNPPRRASRSPSDGEPEKTGERRSARRRTEQRLAKAHPRLGKERSRLGKACSPLSAAY